MQITTQKFFGFIQGHMPSCIANAKNNGWQPDSSCLDPNNYQRISTFFHSFLTKYSQFGNCTTLDNSNKIYNCNANNGTGDYLLLDTNPSSFGMRLLNDQKNIVNESGYGTRWFGYRISCSSLFTSDDIAYKCEGRLPDIEGRLPAIEGYSYYLSETKNGICNNNYSPTPLKGGYVASDCKNGLPLFDKFLSHSTFEEISSLSRVWSFSKLATGAAGTLYFGYKTLIELNNLWKAFEETSRENKRGQLQLEKSDPKTTDIDVVSLEKSAIKNKKEPTLAHNVDTKLVKKENTQLQTKKISQKTTDVDVVSLENSTKKNKEEPALAHNIETKLVKKENIQLQTKKLSQKTADVDIISTKKNGLEDKEESQVTKLTEQQLKNKTLIENSKKRVLVYSVATLASFIFTTMTYFTDFSGVYHTGFGEPIRFK